MNNLSNAGKGFEVVNFLRDFQRSCIPNKLGCKGTFNEEEHFFLRSDSRVNIMLNFRFLCDCNNILIVGLNLASMFLIKM